MNEGLTEGGVYILFSFFFLGKRRVNVHKMCAVYIYMYMCVCVINCMTAQAYAKQGGCRCTQLNFNKLQQLQIRCGQQT